MPKAPRKKATKKHGGKAPNQLTDGYEIRSHGNTHRFYHVHARDNDRD